MKTEIIKYLKEDGSGKWLLIEPHLLYLQADSAKSYLRAMANSKYATGFHSETVKVIASRTNDIVGDERHLCLVDLGPGYPDKAVPIASYCKEKQIKFDYVPVDINEFFLDIAVKEIKKYADNVVPIHALIEKCADKIPDTFRNNALVMIGLTFMNFPPAQILPLLKQIGGEGARVLSLLRFLAMRKILMRSYEDIELQRHKKLLLVPLECLGLQRAMLNME